jgi:hypothetical protein
MGDMGMLDKGEFVLIYIDTQFNWKNVYHAMNNYFFRGRFIFQSIKFELLDTIITLKETWKDNSGERKIVNYARSALAIIPTPITFNDKFESFWNRSTGYINDFGINLKNHQNVQVMPFRMACYLYDAVMLYANAVSELVAFTNHTIEEVINNGTMVIKHILGQKYQSMQGFEMRIDQSGNAQGNYTLLSLQPVEPIMDSDDPDYYPMRFAMNVAGDFIPDLNDPKGTPKLRIKHAVSLILKLLIRYNFRLIGQPDKHR